MNRDLHFSTGNDEHDTPREVFEPISKAVGGFDLDPCASEHSDLAQTNLTEDDDGLSWTWPRGNVWMNPPYSQLTSHTWMQKARQHGDGSGMVVALVPNRTSTQWYQNTVSEASLVCHVEGRITFVGSDNGAPFPSAIVVFGQYPDELKTVLEDMGVVLQ